MDVSGGKDVDNLGKLARVGHTVCEGEEFRSTNWIDWMAIDPDLEGSFGTGLLCSVSPFSAERRTPRFAGFLGSVAESAAAPLSPYPCHFGRSR